MKYEWVSEEKKAELIAIMLCSRAEIMEHRIKFEASLAGVEWWALASGFPQHVREVKESQVIELPVTENVVGMHGFYLPESLESYAITHAPSFMPFRGYKWANGETTWSLETRWKRAGSAGCACRHEMPVAVLWQTNA